MKTAVQSEPTGNIASQSVRVKMVARAIPSLAAATVKMAGRDKCAPIGVRTVFGVSTVRKSAIVSTALLVITLTALANVCLDSLEIGYVSGLKFSFFTYCLFYVHSVWTYARKGNGVKTAITSALA